MPDPTKIVNELERLLKAIKVNNVKDKDVAVLENAKAAFEKICDDNVILRGRPKVPSKLRLRSKP